MMCPPISSQTRRRILAVAIAQCLSAGATAATINVDSGEVFDDYDAICSIVEAVHNANTDSQRYVEFGECEAGSGDDVIVLPAATFTFANATPEGRALPMINSNITFEGNSAVLERAAGAPGFGFFYVSQSMSLTASSLTMRGGVSDYGGAVRTVRGRLYFSDCTFSNNSASMRGGAIHAFPGILEFENCVFEGNRSYSSGGAIRAVGGRLSLAGSTLSGNHAEYGDGGGVAARSSTVTISNSEIRDNSSHTHGGGLYLGNTGMTSSTTQLQLSDTTIADNSARVAGGGVFLRDALTSAVVDSHIIGNQSRDGGGIRLEGGATDFLRSHVSNNEATRFGGGLEMSGGNLQIVECAISENSATWGGGLNVVASYLELRDSTISGNTAVREGGGMAFSGTDRSAELSASSITFSDNEAEDGGGLFIAGTQPITIIINSTFSGNSASRRGGGIHHRDSSLTLVHGTFNSNSATDVGQSLWVDAFSGTVEIANTIVVDDASDGVADCFVDGGSFTVDAGNLVGDGSCNSAVITGDRLTLGVLADNGGPTLTHRLTGALNAAVDGGDPAYCGMSDNDQRGDGFSRVVDGNDDGTVRCDVGSYERQNVIEDAGLIFKDGFE